MENTPQPGCFCSCRRSSVAAAAQVARDGINFHRQLSGYPYEDRAIDNLIRAHNGRGFVQLEYKDLLVQVTDQYFGELSSVQQTTSNEGFGLKSVAGLIPRAFQNTFNIHGSGQRQGQMSFHADPVTNNNDIYQAYLGFANDPARFIVTECPRPRRGHGSAEIGRSLSWVPCQAAPFFQQLVLSTTTMRGPESLTPGFYRTAGRGRC